MMGLLKLYVNGSLVKTSGSVSGNITPVSDDIRIGHMGNDGFNGTLDEIRIFNRSLSGKQVLLLYNNRSDMVASDETNVGDYWNVSITPNDGDSDGSSVWSKTILITNDVISSNTVLEWDNYATLLILFIVLGGFFRIKKE